MKHLRLLISFSVLFAAFACGRIETKEDLIEYVRDVDNGLWKERKIQGVDVGVYVKPNDLIVDQFLAGKKPAKGELEKLRKEREDQLYMILRMSRDEQEVLRPELVDYGRYSELLQQLSFRMRDYCFLVTDKQDTIPLGDYNYPRMYGASAETNVLMVFDRTKLQDTKHFTFFMNEWGLKLGNVRFRFMTEDVQKELRINN